MKPGRASKTAEIVCMGRALAHLAGGAFQDPTALALLSEDGRERVERARASVAPKGLRRRIERAYLRPLSKVMVVRTLAIDEAVRKAGAPQLVVLGAGLDGRAWRMPELSDVTVFEVDHPDSQRDKRARSSALRQTAREIRFVPVDFAQGSLDAALGEAGHDAQIPTTWIWEAVIMYLERRDIDATLEVVARRSAPGSRLVVLYHAPAPLLGIFLGPFVRSLGEPLRSSFRPAAMKELLCAHGLDVVQDRAISELGAAMSAELRASTRTARHLRVVTAERRRV
jgi:methyltransferase (TIGR00027 family)